MIKDIFNKDLKHRLNELDLKTKALQQMGKELKQELHVLEVENQHWKSEAKIWKTLYEKELAK